MTHGNLPPQFLSSGGQVCPRETHYLALKSILQYAAATIDDGIYYWRTEARLDLPDNPCLQLSAHPPMNQNGQLLIWTPVGLIASLPGAPLVDGSFD
jgi:hypothetical protein